MIKKIITNDAQTLIKVINESILEKKGEDILILDSQKTGSSVCDYFVICTGNSETHVNTLAQYIEHNVKKILDDKVWQKEGYENKEWILLDYVNVMVHVFQAKSRNFYRLEQLWADGEIVEIDLNNN